MQPLLSHILPHFCRSGGSWEGLPSRREALPLSLLMLLPLLQAHLYPPSTVGPLLLLLLQAHPGSPRARATEAALNEEGHAALAGSVGAAYGKGDLKVPSIGGHAKYEGEGKL